MALTAALIGGAATLGAAGLGAIGRSNAGQQQQSGLAREQLEQEKANLLQQQINQALVNRRAVAGYTDQYGTTYKYDPATNQWVSSLGEQPLAADRAAMQAAITRNTVDLQQQQLANRESMIRAMQAGPLADAARRQLEGYRPVSQEDLRGQLTAQATEAARQSYDPLRADVLRTTARTGTAAGPVVRELGLGEAQNLRNSLRDALITSMTQTPAVNAARQNQLFTAAANAGALATPQLGQTGIQASPYGAALQQQLAQRAGQAGYTTAMSGQGANTATNALNQGYGAAIKNVADPNYGLTQAVSGLKDLGTYFSSDKGSNLIKSVGDWFSGSSNKMSPKDEAQYFG